MFYQGFRDCFSDKRLDKRCTKITGDLFAKGVHSIRQLSRNSSDAKGFYRFLQNEKTNESILVSDMASRCAISSRGKTVVCIQDSTEINLYNHKRRLKQDGSVGTTNAPEVGLGFFLHPSLVLNAQTSVPLGFSHIKVWNRSMVKVPKSEQKSVQLPVEQKESYKWVETSLKTKEVLSEASSIIIIQDREGDMYEQFARVPDQKTDLLIRVRADRKLRDGTKLYNSFENHLPQCSYSIVIEGDQRKKRVKREANIQVRYKQVEIMRTSDSSRNLPPSTKLYLIEAMETNTKVANPVCWRLLTTIPVKDNDTALACIEWYSWRWMVEEVFRILKKEGFDIEASELEYGASIRKLSILILDTILKLFMMQIAYSIPEEEGIPADTCFTSVEQQCIEEVGASLEGKTEKLKNNFRSKTLKRAVWTIARLGGWKGYQSERPPGITTLWIGLQQFYAIKAGWIINRDVYTR